MTRLSLAYAGKSEGYWLHMPVALMLAIYLIPGLVGLRVLLDQEALTFAILLVIFTLVYYRVAPAMMGLLMREKVRNRFVRVGALVPWHCLAWASVVLYGSTMAIASITTDVTPLGAALRDATGLEIANARASFLANRQGLEAILRYFSVILGRSIMPVIIVLLYARRNSLRHIALFATILSFSLALEKAAPIFVFLPLIAWFAVQRRWSAAILNCVAMVACVGLWAYLAVGAAPEAEQAVSSVAAEARVDEPPAYTDTPPDPYRLMAAPTGIQPHGEYYRYDVLNFLLDSTTLAAIRGNRELVHFFVFVNRVVWIPYITAYDWLKFHGHVLKGELNYGRAIGFVSLLRGEPKLPLERMVYEYQFGPSPLGVGGSNTAFFVEAKLAFGWLGVIGYCVAFSVFAAAVMSTRHAAVKVASLSTFFTAAVSSLTATLLSGGLFLYVLIALLLPERGEVRSLDNKQASRR